MIMLCDDILDMIGEEYLIIQEAKKFKRNYDNVMIEFLNLYDIAYDEYEWRFNQDYYSKNLSNCIFDILDDINNDVADLQEFLYG